MLCGGFIYDSVNILNIGICLINVNVLMYADIYYVNGH